MGLYCTLGGMSLPVYRRTMDYGIVIQLCLSSKISNKYSILIQWWYYGNLRFIQKGVK